MWEQNPNECERPENEMMASCCDLLSGVLEGLREHSRGLMVQMNFVTVISLALRNKAARVKQSGFWLMAVCAMYCIDPILPLLPELMPLSVAGLGPTASMTVSTNACWAIGEVCQKAPPQTLTPFLDALVPALLAILQRRDVKPWQSKGHHELLYTV